MDVNLSGEKPDIQESHVEMNGAEEDSSSTGLEDDDVDSLFDDSE